MAFEDTSSLERAYPYCTGWRVFGCLGLLFGAAGVLGIALVPVGCDQWQNGNGFLGAAALMSSVCLAPMLVLAAFLVVLGVKEVIRPPLLRVSPTALLLPDSVRGQSVQRDEGNKPKPDSPPPLPEEIPFRAIRWIRREVGLGAGNDQLMIVHDLSPVTLALQQNMMRPGDFDELEMVLRAAVPEAFASAPPVPPLPPTPTPTDGD